jgi:hypothetical protein
MLLKEKWNMTVSSAHKYEVVLLMKMWHWSILQPSTAVPIIMTTTKIQPPPAYCTLSCTRWLTFPQFITLQPANSFEMRMAGGGCSGVCWRGKGYSLWMAAGTWLCGLIVLIATEFAFRLTAHRLSTNMTH